MTATTISNNSANYGGGIWIGHDAIAKLTNDTISGNTANLGGGVLVRQWAASPGRSST